MLCGSQQPLVRDEAEHNNLLVLFHQQDFQSASQYYNHHPQLQVSYLYALTQHPALFLAYKPLSSPSHLQSLFRIKPQFHCALCTGCNVLTEISSSEPSLV